MRWQLCAPTSGLGTTPKCWRGTCSWAMWRRCGCRRPLLLGSLAYCQYGGEEEDETGRAGMAMMAMMQLSRAGPACGDVAEVLMLVLAVQPQLTKQPSHVSSASCAPNQVQLGDEVKSAFIATIGSSAAKVVRGVLLTRPGFEEKAAVASNLQVRGVV